MFNIWEERFDKYDIQDVYRSYFYKARLYRYNKAKFFSRFKSHYNYFSASSFFAKYSLKKKQKKSTLLDMVKDLF